MYSIMIAAAVLPAVFEYLRSLVSGIHHLLHQRPPLLDLGIFLPAPYVLALVTGYLRVGREALELVRLRAQEQDEHRYLGRFPRGLACGFPLE
jgi:hypothetical protein